MILVGVCYPSTDTIADVRQKRGRDLRENADAFLKFFIDDIVPFVDNKYRTKVGQNTLIGNSNGGFFATNAFLSYNTTNFPFRNIFSVAHLGLSLEKQANNILKDGIKDIDLNFFLATGDQDTKERIEQYELLRNAIVAGYYPSLHFVARVYKGPHGEVSMTPALHDAFRLFLKKE